MTEDNLEAVLSERQFLEQVDHENILNFTDFFEDGKHILFVMDYMATDLRELLYDVNMPIEESASQEIFYKIVGAVSHLHSLNIIHRDIKLENFLVGQSLDTIKLIDFGVSTEYDPANPPSMACGTSISAAPEMLNGSSYDSKIDCWALGIILFELLCNDLPFDTEDLAQYRKNVLNSKIDLNHYAPLTVLSEQGKDLLSRLLAKDPAVRISCHDALEHPWFDSLK
jgi:serine/threonine protein kinase